MVISNGVGVFEIEVVAAVLDLSGGDFPGDFVLLTALALLTAPPFDAGGEVLDADGFGHRVGFLVAGDAMLVEPDVLGRFAFFEEEEVGADAGVGFEDAVGEADDGVQVALSQKVLFQPRFDPFAEEGTVGEDDGGAAVGLEEADDEGQEEVGRFAGAEVGGEVGLDAVLFAAAEGRVGDDDIDAVGSRVADVGAGEGVVVADEAGVFDAVEQHIGDAEHVRELLFLDGSQGGLHPLLVGDFFDVAVAHMAEGASEEAAGAAGGVEEQLTGLRIDAVHHEGRDGTGGVVFARVAGALQVVEDLLVDVAKVLPLGQVVEIDLVDLVDDLPHELAGLHVVVGIFKDATNDAAAVAGLTIGWQILERGEQLAVNESEQFFAGQPLGIGGPGPPLELFGNGGTVVVAR